MSSTKIGLSVLAVSACLAATAPAAVVFNDTFDSGTTPWFKVYTGGSNPGTLSNASGELSWALQDGTKGIIGRAFNATSLASDGDKLKLTFDWRQTAASVSIIRVGLADITGTLAADGWGANGSSAGTIGSYTGYYSFFRDASGTANEAREQTGTNTAIGNVPTSDPQAPLASTTQNYDINQDGTVTYQVLFELERLSPTSVKTTMTLSSGVTTHMTMVGTDITSAYTSFDSAYIRGGAASTMLLDNIKLEYVAVPEPTSLALLGLGAMGLIRRRR
jgi:hypothetical protein